jgi:hypothetical protein
MQASKANTSSVVTLRQMSGRRERIGSRFHKLKNGSNTFTGINMIGAFSIARSTMRTSAGVDSVWLNRINPCSLEEVTLTLKNMIKR